jgi:hypothetical protein
MPMAKERPMKSSRDLVLYLELSANSHEVGAFMLQALSLGVHGNGFSIDRLPRLNSRSCTRFFVGAWRPEQASEVCVCLFLSRSRLWWGKVARRPYIKELIFRIGATGDVSHLFGIGQRELHEVVAGRSFLLVVLW